MSTPARFDPLQTAPTRIDTCQADFHVTAPNGPLSSPETLLAAVRREILPALSDVLDTPEWQDIDIRAEHIEIDLGHWPDDPAWSDVRYVLATKLRHALADYMPRPQVAFRHDEIQDTAGPGFSVQHASQNEKGAGLSSFGPLPEDTKLIDTFLAWANAASENQKLPLIVARLKANGGERRALKTALGAQFRTPALSGQSGSAVLSDTLDRLVSLAIGQLPSEPEDDAPAASQAANKNTNVGRFVTPPIDGSTVQAGSAQVKMAQERLYQSVLRSGKPSQAAEQFSVALLNRIFPIFELQPADPQTSMDPTSLAPSGDVARTAAQNHNIQTGMTQGTKASDHKTPGTGTSDLTRARGVRADPISNAAANTPSGTKDPLEAQLRRIAATLGIAQGLAAEAFCIKKLVENPRAVVLAASDLKLKHALVRLLGRMGPDQRPLLAKAPLDPNDMRALHSAEPLSFSKAVEQLATTDALDIAQRLLPTTATLLIEQITALQQTAKSPRRAMQQVVMTLLNGDLLDLEELAETSDTAPLMPEIARTDTAISTRRPEIEKHRSDSGTAPDTTNATDQASVTETILFLAGFNRMETTRILGSPNPQYEQDQPPSAQPRAVSEVIDASPSTPHQRVSRSGSEPPKQDLSDTALIAKASRLTRALTGPERAHFADAVDLIWHAWPRAQAADDTIGPYAVLRMHLNLLTAPEEGQTSFSEYLALAVQEIEPDAEKRQAALRILTARLSVPIGFDETGLRRQTHAVVAALMETPLPELPKTQTKPDPVRQPPKATDTETLLVTELAGLVLLSPFIKLLFERLKIEWNDKALVESSRPRALAALHYLTSTNRGQHIDPLTRVILGLGINTPIESSEPDADAQALMDGLLRSVIERWGKLGATSPEGLRETFLRRTGTLRLNDTGAHLRVTPGPFDMLLDGLPWSIERLALPWMPLPCHITWREDSDG